MQAEAVVVRKVHTAQDYQSHLYAWLGFKITIQESDTARCNETTMSGEILISLRACTWAAVVQLPD